MLDTLSTPELVVLVSYLLKKPVPTNNREVLVKALSMVSARTIQDGLRVLRSQGVLIQNVAQNNAAATGAHSIMCPLLVGNEIYNPYSDKEEVVACMFEALHDGPCVGKSTQISGAMKKALSAMQKMQAPMELDNALMQKVMEIDAPNVFGKAEPDPYNSSTSPLKQAVLPSESPSGVYVTHPELTSKFSAFADVLEKDLDIRDEVLEDKIKLVESNFREQLVGIGNATGSPIVQVIELHLPEIAKPIKLAKRPHGAFPKILTLVRAGLNVLMVGPAGSGKTTIAENLSEALRLPFGVESMTAGTSESVLTGRLIPLGAGGAMRYVSSTMICRVAGEKVTFDKQGLLVMEHDDAEAGVMLFDELDNGDANTTVILNSLFANGKISIGARMANGLEPMIYKHKNSILIAAANTYATGMSIEYQGRNALDGAFLDRFYLVEIGYDSILEHSIAELPMPNIQPWKTVPAPNLPERQDFAKWYFKVGEQVKKDGVRKIWGTRALIKGKAAMAAGVPKNEVKRDLLLGWPPDLAGKMLAL